MTSPQNDVARRARVAGFVFIGTITFLLAAFFRTQVIQHERFATLSNENRLRRVPVPAPRGIIYDRNNEIIAENIPGFTVSILADRSRELRERLLRFSQVVPLDSADIERMVRSFSRARPTVVLSDAGFDQVSLLEEHVADIPGLMVQAAPKRFYPDSARVAAFVGYTREITASHLEQERYKGYKQGQQIGAAGLEDQYEEELRGREGTRFHEVNADERPVREDALPELRPESGKSLHTNIDMRLQRFIADSVFSDGAKGAMLVMEPQTGAVLAVYSSPSYDPNEFIGGISATKYNAWRDDPDIPLFNRVVQGAYPPASTYKLAIAVMGLQEGVVTLDSRMTAPCTGGYRSGNRVFGCWKKEGHGSLTLAGAIANSCNVYFYQLGQLLGLDRLVEGAKRLGFGERSGIDLPHETRPGVIPASVDYINKKYPAGWSPHAWVLNSSIGQGEVLQTVGSMARFYSALATDGKAATPHIVASAAPERTQILTLSSQQLDGVRAALASVVSSAGTAGSAAIKGLTIAGKTGTAENRGEDHAWFVGFAPAERPKPGEPPQVLIAVIVEHGLHGYVAARRASRVWQYHFKQKPIEAFEITG